MATQAIITEQETLESTATETIVERPVAHFSVLDSSQGEQGILLIRIEGAWIAMTAGQVDHDLRKLEADARSKWNAQELRIDVSRLARMDTFGAWLIRRLQLAWAAAGNTASIQGASAEHQRLLAAVRQPDLEPAPAKPDDNPFVRTAYSLGRTMYSLRRDTVMGLNVIGAAVRGAQMKLGGSGSVRPASIVHHIDRMGLRAIPIIVLMSFLIGAIIAQQGAFQLRYFGAELFVVDLVGILLLREVGVLLTAIMVAGRTGSAMTAEIGSMKMREEVDALTVIGLNPIGVLVFPRLVALTIALPLLAFIANMAALCGAAVVAQFYSGIPIETFILKLRTAIDLSTVFSGLIKAPFMALIIGTMAAVEGMKVEGSAESMGRRTTAAVVKSIFFVILVDGVFAIFYAQIDY